MFNVYGSFHLTVIKGSLINKKKNLIDGKVLTTLATLTSRTEIMEHLRFHLIPEANTCSRVVYWYIVGLFTSISFFPYSMTFSVSTLQTVHSTTFNPL